MTHKAEKTVYTLGLALTALWFTASGFFEITKNPIVWNDTIALGYPPHFISVLGVAKVTGVIVLLIPNRLLWLKEWVFAGLFFDIIFAFTSGYSVVGPAGVVAPVVAFIMVLVTYVAFRRLNPAIKIGA
jgi:hypothetical protein